MKRHIKYNSIGQFRTIIKDIQHSSQCVGYNEETKEPIFNKNIKFPKIEVIGTEKIHGTNAAWVYTKDEQWCQSRERIITITYDNAGCSFFMENNKELLNEYAIKLLNHYNLDIEKFGVAIFGEFAGGNIQKNSALSGLGKKFMIFKHAKAFTIESVLDSKDESNYWIETNIL
jgi:hypothetical protein